MECLLQAPWPTKSLEEHAAILARISSSRRAQEPITAFSGGALPHTILSTCQGALLGMFDTQSVLPLRATCKDAAAAVAQFPWDDLDTVIEGNLGPALLPAAPGAQKGAWRACFPLARGACVGSFYRRRLAPVFDADFVHFVGLRRLSMVLCCEVTDAAFALLAGIDTLNMCGCNQPAITNAAFAHLTGIRVLCMGSCDQPTITDAAFVNLAGIHTLDMSECSQPTITDAAFSHLAGVHTLDIRYCVQPTITDAAFAHLVGIQSLNMSWCTQPTLTDAAFAHLVGIHTLNMSGCTQPTITDAAFAHLGGVQRIILYGCSDARLAAARAAGLNPSCD